MQHKTFILLKLQRKLCNLVQLISNVIPGPHPTTLKGNPCNHIPLHSKIRRQTL